MRWPYTIIFVLWIIGCSEPFEFETDSQQVDVIDAKVSTIVGRSYVRIYSLGPGENIQELTDLTVQIISGDDSIYPFRYDEASLNYVPESNGFSGAVGETYQLVVYREGLLIFESQQELIAKPVGDFQISIGDSTITIINSGILTNRSGTVFYANLEPTNDQKLKFEFRYFYLDFFTEETVEVNDVEEYELFSCRACPDALKLAAGLVLIDEWYFIEEGCVPPDSITNIIEQCGATSCCEYRADWPIVAEVIVESLTDETFEYWEKVKRLSENDGLVFDTFPFPLKGNVNCVNCEREVLGLFRTAAETSKTMEIIL